MIYLKVYFVRIVHSIYMSNLIKLKYLTWLKHQLVGIIAVNWQQCWLWNLYSNFLTLLAAHCNFCSSIKISLLRQLMIPSLNIYIKSMKCRNTSGWQNENICWETTPYSATWICSLVHQPLKLARQRERRNHILRVAVVVG